MRCAFAVAVVFGLFSGDFLLAAGPTTPAARQPQGLGQLVVVDPHSGSPVRLNLARYHVNVVLHPPVALVQIDQSFYNPYAVQREGTFVFNLPAGASVSRFAMYTSHTELVEGELIDRARAANIYQSIVDRKRDPAILEMIGDNLFKMRVFPIFGQDTKRILLDFTLPIVEQPGGSYRFELPLMSDLKPVWDFAIQGTIRGPAVGGTAHSPSHPELVFDRVDNGATRFEFRKQRYRSESAFVVQFRQRPVADATVRSFAAAGPRNAAAIDPFGVNKVKPEAVCEFLATISPSVLEKNPPSEREPQPADFLILADTSGSVSDRDRLRSAMQMIVKGLQTNDRFALGCVDVGFRPLTPGLVEAGSPIAKELLARFDQELFLGESRFDISLAKAVASLPAAETGRRRIVVYVGDGLSPHSGRVLSADSRKSLVAALAEAQARLFAVLLESAPVGRFLFEQLAAASGGQVLRSGDMAPARDELTSWIQAGFPEPIKIVEVKADGVAQDDLFIPSGWTPDRCLQIFGRRKKAGPMKLELTLERGGRAESHEWELELKHDADDMFVGRLWAQRKVDQLRALEATGDQSPEGQNATASIVSLSQEWTILSPHTAFLVLENESEYPRYGINRQLRHQYWR
ncbi:MAG TPA: VIT and VWA domain-containing protein, partial [Planctomycetaceae bacterium]